MLIRPLLLRFVALLLLVPPIVVAQEANSTLEVTGVQPLVDDPVSYRQIETYLDVNPTDPSHLIATAMAEGEVGGAVVYISRDGGSSWRRAQGVRGALFPGGDPMVAFGQDGRAYLSTLASGFSVWRSMDGGRSWTGPVHVKGSIDRPWIATSVRSEDGPSRVYVAARAGEETETAAVFVSSDDGESFVEKVRIPPEDGTLHAGTGLVVRPDGTLLMPYVAFYGPVRGGKGVRGRRWMLISNDHGQSWSEPQLITETRRFGNEAEQNLSFKELGIGDLAVDTSDGPHDGSVYVAWTNVMEGFIQVMVVRSRDGGLSWREPVRVNRGGHESHHSTAAVAVNRDGDVVVTWNDRRHDPDNQCYHHYAALSTDGGRTFTSERRVSTREVCFPPEYRWQNGGDTQGLVALPNGDFRTVWTGPGPQAARPWTAQITVH